MSAFILMVFAVYGGMHVYAFVRARNAFLFGAGTGAAVAAFMIVMICAPFLIRAFERYEYELPARALSWIAYLWLAALFLFFCGSLVLDLVNLIIRIAGLMSRSNPAHLQVSSQASFYMSLCLSLSICLYGYYEALDIRTERLRIATPKLPAGVDRLTIVQVSDVHLGLIVRRARLMKILNAVKAEKPDIFVSTGDLVDAQINTMEGMAGQLREVKAAYGKYAVTGNHEFYAGLEQALAFTKDAGFTLLRGEAVSSGPINIVGVDDPTGVQMHLAGPVSEKKLLSSLPRNKFTLFLKHQPRLASEAAGLYELQLSGHTHKGQIYPFTYLSALTYPMNAGRFDLRDGSVLYVSRGSGTWGPPIRFLSPPEVTVIELVRA